MTTSAAGSGKKLLSKVDDLVRHDHWYLADDDECYYLGEYTARKGFAFSPTNQLIYNLKKPVSRLGQGDWHYKGEAIQTVARAFQRAVRAETFSQATIIPVPPSKARDDALYDDRMWQVVQLRGNGNEADCRELIVQSTSYQPSHVADHGARKTPDELFAIYSIPNGAAPPRQLVILIDDVLTTGAHFKAAKRLILTDYPDRRVVGLFAARRVPETIDFDEIGNV